MFHRDAYRNRNVTSFINKQKRVVVYHIVGLNGRGWFSTIGIIKIITIMIKEEFHNNNNPFSRFATTFPYYGHLVSIDFVSLLRIRWQEFFDNWIIRAISLFFV